MAYTDLKVSTVKNLYNLNQEKQHNDFFFSFLKESY